MQWIAPSEKDTANGTLEKRLWEAADQFRANSGLTAAQYSQPVLGLIFLRFAEVRFAAQRAKLDKTVASSRRGSRLDDPAAYHADGVLYLTPGARFDHLLALPEAADVGKAINEAMRDIEKHNAQLAGVLPKTYNLFTSTLLIGEPAAGKTTIASMLSMAALDQWGASTLKLNDSAKVLERWNPDEPSQFFWIDDAFGVLQYESDLVHGWNHAFTMIKTMLRKGAKIVLTSRDYIYKRARNDLKEGAFPLLRESQVVIDVRDLTPEEKQQILYNHVKLGKQDREFRTDIKPYLPSIASQGQFVPETARRLADPLFTAELSLDEFASSRRIPVPADPTRRSWCG